MSRRYEWSVVAVGGVIETFGGSRGVRSGEVVDFVSA